MPSVPITSAGRGLGLELAAHYLTEGRQVYGAYRKPASAQKLEGLAQREAGQTGLLALDVTDAETIALAAASMNNRAPEFGSSAASIPSLERAPWRETKRALGRTD